MVVLVALGLWTNGSLTRQILDWEVADQEDKTAWERLVHRLWERGVKLETGLQAIVRDGTEGLEQALDYVYGSGLLQQRCIFHKLRNVSDKCIGLTREDKKQFLEQARTRLSSGDAHQKHKSGWLHRLRSGEPHNRKPLPPLSMSLSRPSVTLL